MARRVNFNYLTRSERMQAMIDMKSIERRTFSMNTAMQDGLQCMIKYKDAMNIPDQSINVMSYLCKEEAAIIYVSGAVGGAMKYALKAIEKDEMEMYQ